MSESMEQRLQSLERGLDKADRRSRRLLVASVVVLLGIALAWNWSPDKARATPSAAQEIIRAKAFLVVDERGAARAVIGIHDDVPTLNMYDRSGQVRVGLVVTGDMSAMTFRDLAGEIRLGLGEGELGGAVELYDGKVDIPRAVLGAAKSETRDGRTITFPESSLRLSGPDGTVLWSAPR